MVFITYIPVPGPWDGLFTALASKRYPDRKADIWYCEATDSRYGHGPTWYSLLESMTVLEPYISQEMQQLSFKPRMLHLPTNTQVGFLQFLCRHSNRIADSEIQAFVNQLRPYVEPNSVVLPQLMVLHRSIKSAGRLSDVIHSQEKITGEHKEKAAVNVTPLDQPAETREVIESGSIIHHDDDVIIIDLDSDDETPKPKRLKLDNVKPATDEDSNIDSNAVESLNTDEEMVHVCDNSNNQLDDSSVDSSDNITPDSVNYNNSHATETVESAESRKDKTAIILSQDKEQAIGRLKEIWHSATTAETCPAQELELLVSLTAEEMESAVQTLELTEMSEASVHTACSHLVSVSELISYSNCVCFLKFALLGKVMTLAQNASRVLVSAVTMAANRYPKQFIDSVLVPCVVGSFELPQLDLVTRLLKESLSGPNQLYFMNNFIAGQELEINDCKIALVQTLLETLNINDEVLVKIVKLFDRQATRLAKNLKFGKLLLALVNKHGKLLGGDNLIRLSNIVDKHQTFVKKSIENAIKKLRPVVQN